ncbi:MAG: helix-turn-helix domain-containing protein [Tannerellaceae bacterium]|jgi:transcriptional regulator with XRE-family HTH domain|nr:helix-turn-helix domain-containing protein [Tannerellaceae bacterium]
MIDIDKLSKERRLSKTDIAKRMGLSRESLYRILSGNPTLENIQKLADAIGISVSELFEEKDNSAIYCPNCGAKLKIVKE